MSEQVPCKGCGKSYTRRGIAVHERACKAVAALSGAFSGLSVSSREEADCERCGRSFSRRGIAAHQRTCKAQKEDSYTSLFHKYVLEGAMAGMSLGAAPPHMPDMHDPEDREEVVVRCRELEAQLSEAEGIRRRVAQEMERVGAGMPEGPMVPLSQIVDSFIPRSKKRIKDKLSQDATVIVVTRQDGLQCSDENDYLYLVLKYGLKYVPAGNGATRSLLVPWPSEEAQDAYASRVFSDITQLREMDQNAARVQEASTRELYAMFSA